MRLSDRALGLHRPIARRDFLNGAAFTAGAFAVGGALPAWAGAAPYPPALTGLRGQTDEGNSIMHSLRDGSFWQTAGAPEDTGEVYDLIVVGAGISGLAAAFLYRQQAGSQARILILDNNDDFGGHARRNEFTASNGATFFTAYPQRAKRACRCGGGP